MRSIHRIDKGKWAFIIGNEELMSYNMSNEHSTKHIDSLHLQKDMYPPRNTQINTHIHMSNGAPVSYHALQF